MSSAILGLTAGFVLLGLLLLVLLLKTHYPVIIKLVMVVLVTGFYWLQYESLQQYGGWPALDDLPDKFVLIASDIREPDSKNNQPGIIYWWLRDSGKPDQPPRLFQLPYRTSLHEKTVQVIKAQKSGGRYIGQKSTESGVQGAVNSAGYKFEKAKQDERFQKE